MYDKKSCEHLRSILNEEFETFKPDLIDAFHWVNPHRVKYLTGKQKGKRDTNHIVDTTHIIAHRSMVAGFSEGNTSATRPWFVYQHPDKELNKYDPVKFYLQQLRDRAQSIATSSNLYQALSMSYGDWGVMNTSCLYIDELPTGPHFTVLDPGTYRLMNDMTGIANVLLREWPMSVKNIVEEYGVKVNGKYDWSNFSNRIKNLYNDGEYNTMITICEIVKPNDLFNPNGVEGGTNRKWVMLTYESGGISDQSMYNNNYRYEVDKEDENRWLRIQHRTRKPFIAYRNESSQNFAYGETGSTTRALGMIKSLNKKAMTKDIALDYAMKPPMTGPSALKKSYTNLLPGQYIGMSTDQVLQGGKAQALYDMRPAVSLLEMDVADIRSMVRKLYYEDLMLFLSQNPKTRTAEEVRAVISEQQLVIGPTLQSLTYTLNTPLSEYLADYALFEDPYLPPPPPELEGASLRTLFISVFAQAQRAADLPNIERYVGAMMNLAAIDPRVLDKVDLDTYADLYEDRLFLPAGLNRSTEAAEARRQQNQQMQLRQQQMTEMVPALARARKDDAQAEQALMAIQEK